MNQIRSYQSRLDVQKHKMSVNLPGMNNTHMPSTDPDIKPARYLSLFKQFMDPAIDLQNLYESASEYEIALCSAVYNAYVALEREDGIYYGKQAPRQILLKTAMQKCRGSLNPGDVGIMIDVVRDTFYIRHPSLW